MNAQKISIYENGVWAGNGNLSQTAHGEYYIADCPAELGANSGESEGAYEAIQDAIDEGGESVTHGEYTWTWTIEEAE